MKIPIGSFQKAGHVLWLASFLFLAGCAGTQHILPVEHPPTPESERAIRQRFNAHIIAIDANGVAVEPYDYRYSGKSYGGGFLKAHFGGVTNLQVHLHSPKGTNALIALGYNEEQRSNIFKRFPNGNSFVFRDVVVPNILEQARQSSNRVVIYVHGGLNNLDDAIGRAERFLFNQDREKQLKIDQDVYPIFICWPSGLGSAYWQHLWFVRNGVNMSTDKSYWHRASVPLYFLTDVATSIVRLPRTITDLARSGQKTDAPFRFRVVQDSRARYYALRFVAYSLEHKDRSDSENFFRWRSSLLPYETNDLARLEKSLQKPYRKRSLPEGSNVEKLWAAIAGDLLLEWREIQAANPDWKPVTVALGEYHPTAGDNIGRKALGWGLIAPKTVVAGTLSAGGSEAWAMMCRRVDTMYHDERSFRPAYGVPPFRQQATNGVSGERIRGYEETNEDVRDSTFTGIGAMSVFFRQLAAAQNNQTNRLRNTIDAYAHSMGAIVLNRGLQAFPSIQFRRVVFMSAACSIKDFSLSVVPYMAAQPKFNSTEFYNLCLNPRAEEREKSAWEWVPRGSLLIWIDEFLQRPSSFEDRVLGHFENALLASKNFPSQIQSRIHMVAMPAGIPECEYGELQSHGAFSAYRFWDESFPLVSVARPRDLQVFRLKEVKNEQLTDQPDQTK